MAKMLKVKLVRSPIGHPRDQKETLYSLKLRKLNREVVLPDNPSIRGMLRKVQHLVEVEEIDVE